MFDKRWEKLFALLIVGSMIFTACGGSSDPEVVEKEVTRVVQETVIETVKETVIVEGTPQVVEQEVTKVVEVEKVVTATPEPERVPGVGGTIVIGLAAEPGTLDAHFVNTLVDINIADMLGAPLVYMDVENVGELIPGLAESWEVSEDGLVYTFKLRQDVEFHDGTPLTAQDYAWTFQRMFEVEGSMASQLLDTLELAEAVDDYTLQLTVTEPDFSFIYSIADGSRNQPLLRSAVEEWGDTYGKHPVGVGPYRFKEWQTGEKIVLERNPDYNWGPAYAHQGPSYIESIEYRFIPESAILLAGLETGEIDDIVLQPKDLEYVEGLGEIQVFEQVQAGLSPYISLNLSDPLFTDLRVRQAFNCAIDRQVLIDVVAKGQAVPQYGLLSPPQIGYWPGVEYIGHHYDQEKAQALLGEAGWTDSDGDGMLEKDGEPLQVTLLVSSERDESTKAGEVLQQQFKAVGVDLQLELLEHALNVGAVIDGDYEMSLFSLLSLLPDWYYYTFHSGVYNLSHHSDAELDSLLDSFRTADSVEERQERINDVQKHFIDQAILVPLFAPKNYFAVNERVKGLWMSDSFGLIMTDAYIETTVQ